MTRRRAVRRCAALCAASLALVSCSHSARDANVSGPTTTARRSAVLVAIGSNATIGDGLDQPLTQAWPQLLYHQAVPIATVFVNAADLEESASRALTVAVPLALDVHATVVAIWIGDRDLMVDNEAGFATDLDLIVRRLRGSGARVLIGNLSRAQQYAPAFDTAIARIARARGATLVDLASALAATPDVGPSSKMTPETSRAVADAFAAAIERS